MHFKLQCPTFLKILLCFTLKFSFTRYMIIKMAEAPISNDDIHQILDFCPLKGFHQNPDALKKLVF